jgi:hypothetical protein
MWIISCRYCSETIEDAAKQPPRTFADEAGLQPTRVGARYAGRRDGDRIAYAGKIQVGLTFDEASELRATLQQFIQSKASFSHPAAQKRRCLGACLLTCRSMFTFLTLGCFAPTQPSLELAHRVPCIIVS